MPISRDATDLLPMDINETDYVSFDFTDLLYAGETINPAAVSVSCEVSTGVDASASSRRSGSPVIGSTVVRQLMTTMQDGVTYLVRCQATLAPTGRVLVLAGLVPGVKVGT